jgi:HK97 family phage major capsid protein
MTDVDHRHEPTPEFRASLERELTRALRRESRFAPPSLFDPPSLFGRPVEISADLAAPGLLAKSAVIADFQSAYTVRIVRGIGVQRQDEVHSDTGQLGFRAYLRTDGRVVLADAARILQHSAA